MKKLTLRKETLAELTAAELASVAGGGAESESCPITYKCVYISDNCLNSIVCIGVSGMCGVGGC